MIIKNKENYTDIMAKFLDALGYKDIKKSGNDSLVAITGVKDDLKIGFACRYDIDAISGKVMEEFIAAAKGMNLDKMVFITNSSFSSAAKKTGETAGVELWDRNHIDRLAIGIDVCLEEPERRKESHKAVYIVVGVIAVLVLVAVVTMYFNPTLFGLLG